MAGKTTEEPKQTLPSGHPQAGYISPDRFYSEGTGTLPPDEQQARDELLEEREADVEAVEANEDKVAKEEAKAAEAAAKQTETTTKAAAKSETSS